MLILNKLHSKAVYALTSCFSLTVSAIPTIFNRPISISASAFVSTSRRGFTTFNHSPIRIIGTYRSSIDRTKQGRREMSTDATETNIKGNLEYVISRITETLESCNKPSNAVRLIAVSKTKPLELLMDAYNNGQRYFGENYAQELMSKAQEMPDDTMWHFIGLLQSNKAAPLVKSLGKKLACIETVSTIKLANKLNNAVKSLNESGSEISDYVDHTLGIYIQVNTSGEDSKSGVNTLGDCVELAKEISTNLDNLRIDGLMTIGSPGDFTCFDKLVEYRRELCESMGVDEDSFELSMGMSGDFDEAIRRGATSVRVGSTIFGARDYSKKL